MRCQKTSWDTAGTTKLRRCGNLYLCAPATFYCSGEHDSLYCILPCSTSVMRKGMSELRLLWLEMCQLQNLADHSGQLAPA